MHADPVQVTSKEDGASRFLAVPPTKLSPVSPKKKPSNSIFHWQQLSHPHATGSPQPHSTHQKKNSHKKRMKRWPPNYEPSKKSLLGVDFSLPAQAPSSWTRRSSTWTSASFWRFVESKAAVGVCKVGTSQKCPKFNLSCFGEVELAFWRGILPI